MLRLGGLVTEECESVFKHSCVNLTGGSPAPTGAGASSEERVGDSSCRRTEPRTADTDSDSSDSEPGQILSTDKQLQPQQYELSCDI